MIEVITHSLLETQALANQVGRVLKGGEVCELVSDVGGGKTSFVKGLAQGLEVDDVVQSPTFTISRVYKARDNLELHHFDFYRLQEAGVMAAELAESLAQPNAIVAVEWSDIVHEVLPKNRITLVIKTLGEATRCLEFTLPAGRDDLLQVINQFKESANVA